MTLTAALTTESSISVRAATEMVLLINTNNRARIPAEEPTYKIPISNLMVGGISEQFPLFLLVTTILNQPLFTSSLPIFILSLQYRRIDELPIWMFQSILV
jgi:hypothetical protein